MQRCVDIPPHLTYVATLRHYLVKHELPKKSTKFTVFQKNQADTFVTKLWLIVIL